ncbi:MAG TPA: hypothetical protein VF619_07755 [Allosphingosinicella sp.]|jgi:hypothetical protein
MTQASTTAAPEPRRADRPRDGRVRYSICTLVTDLGEYAEMVQSFREHGFGGADCEFLYLDNSESNAFDAFAGYNLFLTEAAGDYVILCHQDILLLEQGRPALEERLAELDELDPAWGLCGNAGGAETGKLALRISDPHGTDQAIGPFPARAAALDENFIVARRDANLAVSHDMQGFHLYGADLCIVADMLGRSAYVIDFHLRHKSAGNTDARFYAARREAIAKYRRAFRTRWVRTTCTTFLVSGLPLLGRALSSRLGRPFRR